MFFLLFFHLHAWKAQRWFPHLGASCQNQTIYFHIIDFKKYILILNNHTYLKAYNHIYLHAVFISRIYLDYLLCMIESIVYCRTCLTCLMLQSNWNSLTLKWYVFFPFFSTSSMAGGKMISPPWRKLLKSNHLLPP